MSPSRVIEEQICVVYLYSGHSVYVGFKMLGKHEQFNRNFAGYLSGFYEDGFFFSRNVSSFDLTPK